MSLDIMSMIERRRGDGPSEPGRDRRGAGDLAGALGRGTGPGEEAVGGGVRGGGRVAVRDGAEAPGAAGGEGVRPPGAGGVAAGLRGGDRPGGPDRQAAPRG